MLLTPHLHQGEVVVLLIPHLHQGEAVELLIIQVHFRLSAETYFQCSCMLSGFVKMSAGLFSPEMCCTLSSCSCANSLMKKYLASMCLLLPLNIGSLVKEIVLVLSHQITGTVCDMFRSVRSCFSHMHSCAAEVQEYSSASHVESATLGDFVAFQLIGLFPRQKRKP